MTGAIHDAIPELTLGWRLQMALDYAGLKHGDIASKFEVSRQTVSRWCNDVGPAPKKFILNEIARMCGVSPRWLIHGDYTSPDGPGDGGVRDKTVGLLLDFPNSRTASSDLRNAG